MNILFQILRLLQASSSVPFLSVCSSSAKLLRVSTGSHIKGNKHVPEGTSLFSALCLTVQE